jgi:hypothetical protein
MISRKHEKVDDDHRKHILEILVGSASWPIASWHQQIYQTSLS